ncbi:MAG: cytidylate kinase-like family protein [Verrucomicrobium sp.]|nr:cytidylate kinase-like family protein [Verrucomicrobium sp.]
MFDTLAPLRTYLESHLRLRSHPGETRRPVVTISRQRGAEGAVIARRVASLLTERSGGRQSWLVMDEALAERVVQDHALPKRIEQFLAEEHVSTIADVIEELANLHPSRWTLVEKMAETILHMAELGHVIFVGRAANIVTASCPDAFHVRIIGSLEKRVARLVEEEGMTEKEARAQIAKKDRDRDRFAWHYFHVRAQDPLQYDLLINTDRVSIEAAAGLIAQLAEKK